MPVSWNPWTIIVEQSCVTTMNPVTEYQAEPDREFDATNTLTTRDGKETMTTVAQIMAETLKELGVRYIFGVPSGNWTDYMAAIQQTEGLEFILISNEGAAGFMADVCWRLTGQVAACFGTFGPGACNLTTGVCGGYLDRSPMLAFTDEMNDLMRSRVTQMNIDHQALFKPITKWTTRLEPGKVKKILYKAFQTATAEVPGPVHIGLPAGIAMLEANEETPIYQAPVEISPADPAVLDKMNTLFNQSRKPVMTVGIGALRFDVQELIVRILEKFRIPVVLTPMAKGLLSEDHPSYTGVLAHALSDQVGLTHQQADLVIGIGYDSIEINYEDWMPQVPLLNIDTRPADLDRDNFTLGLDVIGHLNPSLESLLSMDCGEKEWHLEEVAERKAAMFARFSAPPGIFGPRKVLEELRAILPSDGIMTCDVGAHLHLIGQQWKTDSPDCQLMSNGCSSMGFAVPAAIAAKLCCPDREVCCVVGDGGFYMAAGEIATAKRLGLAVVFVLMTDGQLSLIKIKQERKGYASYGTQLQDFSDDFETYPTLFGVPVMVARDADQCKLALQQAFADAGPVIVEAIVNGDEYDELILKGNV